MATLGENIIHKLSSQSYFTVFAEKEIYFLKFSWLVSHINIVTIHKQL